MRAFLLALLLCPQEQVDQGKVDRAIDAGAKYLLDRLEKGLPQQTHFNHNGLTKRDIVLYALVYAGINESNGIFKKALDEMLAEKIVANYGAAIQALVLEALDPIVYHERIAQCAQFLIDNQCKNGQWFYGKEVELGPWKLRKRPSGTATMPRTMVKRRKMVGGEKGDNSNTQYAILGLRACLMSGIEMPRETLIEAEAWWVGAQNKDGGWDYDCYETRAEQSYGGMTVGAIGSLAILKYYLKKDIKRDPSIKKGVEWVARNLSVTEHPKFMWTSPESKWRYYWLYALERAGMLLELEKFGDREWYTEGALHLLEQQRKDGSWIDNDKSDPVTATAFAILFLRRATKKLAPVPTEDARKKEK